MESGSCRVSVVWGGRIATHMVMTEQRHFCSRAKVEGESVEEAESKSPCMKLCLFRLDRSHAMRGLFVPRPTSQPDWALITGVNSVSHTISCELPLMTTIRLVCLSPLP